MPVNRMSVGRDYSFGLFDPNTGEFVEFGDVQGVRVNASKHDIKSMPYNDVPKFGYIPDGYMGEFRVTRTSPKLELLQLALNGAFNAGQTISAGYLNERIKEVDGTFSNFQYLGAVFFVTELCDVTREKVIPQAVVFAASDKVALA